MILHARPFVAFRPRAAPLAFSCQLACPRISLQVRTPRGHPRPTRRADRQLLQQQQQLQAQDQHSRRRSSGRPTPPDLECSSATRCVSPSNRLPADVGDGGTDVLLLLSDCCLPGLLERTSPSGSASPSLLSARERRADFGSPPRSLGR